MGEINHATTRRRAPLWLVIALLVYVAAVHLIDSFAMTGRRWPIDWTWFHWSMWHGSGVPRMPGFDLFKFAAWFVVPFLFLLPRIDWGYLGVRRWKRIDMALLVGLALLSVVAVLAILVVPGLRGYYPSLNRLADTVKWTYFIHYTVYTLSWLIGWEFVHRYALLTVLTSRWPRWGWLLIPVYEFVYHLTKHPIEAAGMFVASVVLTQWAMRRRNTLLPFLAHLAIELELIAFLLWV